MSKLLSLLTEGDGQPGFDLPLETDEVCCTSPESYDQIMTAFSNFERAMTELCPGGLDDSGASAEARQHMVALKDCLVRLGDCETTAV